MAAVTLKDPQFDALAKQWADQKEAEKRATAARVETEQKLLDRLVELSQRIPEEGDVTFDTGSHKVTISFKINRKITDEGLLEQLQADIPETLRPWKTFTGYKLEAAGVRWLMENEPGLATVLSKFVEEKPAKPGFKVQEA